VDLAGLADKETATWRRHGTRRSFKEPKRCAVSTDDSGEGAGIVAFIIKNDVVSLSHVLVFRV